jgi:hypothetical protein
MEIIQLLVTSKSRNYHHQYHYIIFLLILTCGHVLKPAFAGKCAHDIFLDFFFFYA